MGGANLADGIQENEWNGERLFQVVKLATETQYQHLVFEEFARKIAPSIHPLGNVDIHLDPAITAEFAHAVYRFGHSMLDETLPRFQLNADGTNSGIAVDNHQIGLIEAFLNPLAYLQQGADAAGQIALGTTSQVGNEIDEFVTGALRNNLLRGRLDHRRRGAGGPGQRHHLWRRGRRRGDRQRRRRLDRRRRRRGSHDRRH